MAALPGTAHAESEPEPEEVGFAEAPNPKAVEP